MTHAYNVATAFALNDIFNSMHTDVAKIGYRGLINSLNTRAIYLTDRHIRTKQREMREALERNEAIPGGTTMDAAHEILGDEARTEELNNIKEQLGFKPTPDFEGQARTMRQAANWMTDELKTLSDSMYDEPMQLSGMFNYLTDRAQNQDAFIRAASEVTGIPEAELKTFTEISDKNERERLKANRSEILDFLQSVDGGYESAFEDLPLLTRHQLLIKLVDVLNKGIYQTLERVRRTKKLDQLSTITLLKSEIARLEALIKDFERHHRNEILEAMEQGAQIKTLA